MLEIKNALAVAVLIFLNHNGLFQEVQVVLDCDMLIAPVDKIR